MKTELLHIVKEALNKGLALLDLELLRRSRDPVNYISLRRTLAEAERAGLSVGDYIDYRHNIPGATQLTIEKMKDLGIFKKRIERVLEIGPGSGRYLEKTLEQCTPRSYEIYESAADWRDWLGQKYPVVAHVADGFSLAQTPTHSIDLTHAHKVFPVLPVITACHYMEEMARVTRDGGWVVYDVLTEHCLTREELHKWYPTPSTYVVTMIGRSFAIEFMRDRGFRLEGEFFITMLPGKTHYLAFRRRSRTTKTTIGRTRKTRRA